jgi:CBS domain-containing protein
MLVGKLRNEGGGESIGGRFGRRRSRRGAAMKQAIGPLGIVRGRSGHGERNYGAAAVGLGFGALVIVTGAFSLLLRRRRRAAGEEAVLLRVRDLMTSDPVTIEPQASVVDAARRMIQKKKGPLPVVEGDGRAVGMVTDRDIIARVVAEGRDPGSVTVEDIATRELVTIGADQDFAEAARLMAEHQLDRLLVVEGERLVGIISEADIRLDEGPLV